MELTSKYISRLLQMLLLGLAAVSVACSSSSAPPSPPAKADEGEYSSSSKNLKSKDAEADPEEDDEEIGKSAEDEEEETSSSSFDFGGAEVGEKEVVDAVKSCHEKGNFYDRFDEDEALGKCTKLKLAKVDCTTKALKKVLSEKQKEQFETAMADDSSTGYKGWKIDQCLDCEKEADEDLCKNSSGKEQVGTKIFFVKEENNEISGKSMVLPVRPGQ